MKKKIFVLIPLLLLLCGCTAQVNITIDSNKITESVSIDAYPNSYLNKEELLGAFRKNLPIFYDVTLVDTMPDEKEDGIKYYERNVRDLGNGYRVIYNTEFSLNNYVKARTVKGAFKSSTIQVNKKDKEIVLSTDKSKLLYFNDYPDLNNVTINITSSYKVKEHNADSVNGSVYTWIFDKNTEKNIYMVLDSNVSNGSSNGANENGSSNNISNNSNQVQEEYDNELEKVVNEHPFLTIILAIFGFIIIVFITTKLTKKKY